MYKFIFNIKTMGNDYIIKYYNINNANDSVKEPYILLNKDKYFNIYGNCNSTHLFFLSEKIPIILVPKDDIYDNIYLDLIESHFNETVNGNIFFSVDGLYIMLNKKYKNSKSEMENLMIQCGTPKWYIDFYKKNGFYLPIYQKNNVLKFIFSINKNIISEYPITIINRDINGVMEQYNSEL